MVKEIIILPKIRRVLIPGTGGPGINKPIYPFDPPIKATVESFKEWIERVQDWGRNEHKEQYEPSAIIYMVRQYCWDVEKDLVNMVKRAMGKKPEIADDDCNEEEPTYKPSDKPTEKKVDKPVEKPVDITVVKRSVGRPKKVKPAEEVTVAPATVVKRGRGRPKKITPVVEVKPLLGPLDDPVECDETSEESLF